MKKTCSLCKYQTTTIAAETSLQKFDDGPNCMGGDIFRGWNLIWQRTSSAGGQFKRHWTAFRKIWWFSQKCHFPYGSGLQVMWILRPTFVFPPNGNTGSGTFDRMTSGVSETLVSVLADLQGSRLWSIDRQTDRHWCHWYLKERERERGGDGGAVGRI